MRTLKYWEIFDFRLYCGCTNFGHKMELFEELINHQPPAEQVV